MSASGSEISWVIWLPLAGVVCGSVMQFMFSLLSERGKRREQLRTEAYVGYLAAVASSALYQSGESRQKILADAAHAKSRIVIYGTSEVVEALVKFERAGATAATDEGRQCLTDIVIAMRGNGKISRTDIDYLLLGAPIREDAN